MKKWMGMIVVLGLLATFGNLTALENRAFKTTAPSRAAVAGQVQRLAAQVRRSETQLAEPGPAGVKIYGPQATGRLLGEYQTLAAKLAYLKSGVRQAAVAGWDNYRFDGNGGSFDPADVRQALQEIAPELPQQFLKGFRIFLLPKVIPQVAGLGGPGYTLLGGQSDPADLTGDMLRVTLYHELGHSVHMSYMDRGQLAGVRRWDAYLKLRGGVWHGPGAVNTADWSSSSEETFAEDFRMLFGKDQPFFGDIRLGDPRRNPERAAAEKRFVVDLVRGGPEKSYESPWLPKDLTFWRLQPALIAGLWAMLGAGLLAVRPVRGAGLTSSGRERAV